MADVAVTDHASDAHDHHDDHGGHVTSTGLSNNKLAMWIFLGSECLLFGGLISTYMLYRGRHSENLGPDQVWDIPFTSASSFVLLMSSLTMVLAVTAAQRKDDRNTNLWLTITALLGSLFVAGQVYEYSVLVSEFVTLNSDAFGSAFYLTTGFHGLHVTGGLIAFLLVIGRAYAVKTFTHRDATSAIVVSYYWHFVDVVWIGLFLVIYILQ